MHTVDKHPELPDAILVRPDGYVAWASERMPSSRELTAAIERWLLNGAPPSSDAQTLPSNVTPSHEGGRFHARRLVQGVGRASRTGMAWDTTPMPAPRIGQIGQKYQAPAVSPTASHTASTITTIAR